MGARGARAESEAAMVRLGLGALVIEGLIGCGGGRTDAAPITEIAVERAPPRPPAATPPSCPAGAIWDDERRLCTVPDYGGRTPWTAPTTSPTRARLDPCGDPDALVDCHPHD